MAKKIKAEGEYMARTDAKTTVLRLYEEEFILDEVRDAAQARSMLKNGLLHDRLRKIEGYKRVRTIEIVSFEDTDEKAKQTDFQKLLVKATKAGCVPEGLDNYDSDKGKMKALERALDNHKKRQAKETKKTDNVKDMGYVD